MASEPIMTHQWDDPLFLESSLSEDERMIRDMARGYCTDKLMPRVKSAYREERFDRMKNMAVSVRAMLFMVLSRVRSNGLIVVIAP